MTKFIKTFIILSFFSLSSIMAGTSNNVNVIELNNNYKSITPEYQAHECNVLSIEASPCCDAFGDLVASVLEGMGLYSHEEATTIGAIVAIVCDDAGIC